MATEQFPCPECTSTVSFDPATGDMRCAHCGGRRAVDSQHTSVPDFDYEFMLREVQNAHDRHTAHGMHCSACGAETLSTRRVESAVCPFCRSSIVASAGQRDVFKPDAVLPFEVSRAEACKVFRRWVSRQWLTPAGFARRAGLNQNSEGVYIPHWVFDCVVRCRYSSVHRRKDQDPQIISGAIDGPLRKIAVCAGWAFPEKLASSWRLEALLPYHSDYLAGFRSESCEVDVLRGFFKARQTVREELEQQALGRIGGPSSDLHSLGIEYERVAVRLVMLPVWVSTYRFKDQLYHFVINGQSGEIRGKRPWCPLKIGSAAAACVAGLGISYRFRDSFGECLSVIGHVSSWIVGFGMGAVVLIALLGLILDAIGVMPLGHRKNLTTRA